MMENLDREYEISRCQVGLKQLLIRSQKLHPVDRHDFGTNEKYEIEVRVEQGTEQTEIQSFSKELGITAGGEFKAFNAEISAKFTETLTTEYKAFSTKEVTKKITPADYKERRTSCVCAVQDILRIIEIPSEKEISKLTTTGEKTVSFTLINGKVVEPKID